jgi:hypothetical protein
MDMTGEASHFDLTHPFFLWESENNVLPCVFLNGLNELQERRVAVGAVFIMDLD